MPFIMWLSRPRHPASRFCDNTELVCFRRLLLTCQCFFLLLLRPRHWNGEEKKFSWHSAGAGIFVIAFSTDRGLSVKWSAWYDACAFRIPNTALASSSRPHALLRHFSRACHMSKLVTCEKRVKMKCGALRARCMKRHCGTCFVLFTTSSGK
jgi:hypothetical protein